MDSTTDSLVKIFTTPTCHFCHLVKNYLTELKVDFAEVDLTVDHAAANWLTETTGQQGVPITLFNDAEFVVGWQKDLLDTYLRQYKLIK